MKEFILSYYREIIVCISLVSDFILSLVILVKKSKKQTPLTLDLLELVPKYISAAEKLFGSGNGQEKRNFVLDRLSELFHSYTGKTIDEITFKFLSDAIEEILKTPQKKEKL